MKVPARRAGFAEFFGDPLIERVSISTHDAVFLRERKIDGVACCTELLDLRGRPRFLSAEIVRRYPQHNKTAPTVALPKRLEITVLRRVPAVRGSVDDQHRPTPPCIERQAVAIDRGELEPIGILGISHRGLFAVSRTA